MYSEGYWVVGFGGGVNGEWCRASKKGVPLRKSMSRLRLLVLVLEHVSRVVSEFHEEQHYYLWVS